jgi:hypothetical protein
MRLSVLTLLFTLVATFHTVIPPQAEAGSALFRVKQSWSGLTNNGTTFGPVTYTSPDYHPRLFGPGKAPPAQGLLNHTTHSFEGFSIPSKVIKSYGTKTCFPLGCNPPLFYSAVFNAYWNAKATFQKSRPGAPTTTVTLRFDTTMGNPWPPPWTGEPVSPTTQFSGNYDFSRSGTIRIIPGVNRFGGTLRMLAWHNQTTVKRFEYARFARWHHGAGTLPRYMFTTYPYSHTTPLQTAYRYRSGIFTTTTVIKILYINSPPPSANQDNPIPWTTGTVYVAGNPYYIPPGIFISASGYDNRTSMGLYGNISMVRPRLVHRYAVRINPPNSGGPYKQETIARIDRITVHFLPEPGSMAMLAAGLMGLLSLYLYRRD